MIIYNDKLFLEHATLKKFSLHDINNKKEILFPKKCMY